MLFCARIDEAFEVSDTMVAIADAECSPSARWLAHVNSLSSTLAREGTIAGGLRNDQILGMGQDANEADALQWWGSAASSVFWLMGEGGDVADTAGMFAAQFPGLLVWYTGYAWMLCEGGRHDEARAVVEAQGLRFNTVEDASLPLCGTHQLAAIAWELDDAEMAANLIPVLEKYVGHWSHYFLVPIGPVTWGLGAVAVGGGRVRPGGAARRGRAGRVALAYGFHDHAVHCAIHLARILHEGEPPRRRRACREVLADAARPLGERARAAHGRPHRRAPRCNAGWSTHFCPDFPVPETEGSGQNVAGAGVARSIDTPSRYNVGVPRLPRRSAFQEGKLT